MSGLVLAAVALGVAGVALGHYATTVRAVRVAKRPRVHQSAIVAAALLALGALFSGAGLLGGAVAVLVLMVAAVFLFLTTQSALPAGRIAVAVGGPALEFTASDSDGRTFMLSSLRGQRILLKFFRGHW
jgi:hypothetical protein